MSRIPSGWYANGPGVPTSKIVRVACTMEAAAPKPGNVHPGASFGDVAFEDFVASAAAIEPVFRESGKRRVGAIILDSVRATQEAVGSNTNLGMILLLAPLAAVPRDVQCRDGIGEVLAGLNAEDCRDVYAAIRLAQPGGLGKADKGDVADDAPSDLLAAMQMAADRDLVARQYTNRFADILDFVTPAISRFASSEQIEDSIVLAQLATMAEYPDSLIQRKCGREMAVEASEMAGRVLNVWQESRDDYDASLSLFDQWLRADGNRRNPGTTADLLAAALFVYIRDRDTVA